jgi:signal transduction histidine kinase
MDEKIAYALIFCTMLFLFLFSVIVIVFFISGRRKIRQEMMLSQTMLAYEKELRTIESEVSEQILTHMGQELHDNVGALHTAMNIQLENIKIDHPGIAQSFVHLESTLANATGQIRTLGRTLNGEYVRVNGLLKAIEMEIKRLHHLRKFAIALDKKGTASPLSKNEEIIVFRIFQEFSQNTLKHAAAKNLYIKIFTDAKSFNFSLQDDGIGFDTGKIMKVAALSGIRNIQKRAELANFECLFESSPGNGTKLALNKRYPEMQ